jgi:hypothetical protein
MFDLFNGLPVHPLVVHAVVVLLPLAVLGTIAIALVPRWRSSYGPLVVGSALVASVLIPVATSSGEELEHRVGDPGEHAALGDQLIWFAVPLLVLSALLVWTARRVPAPGEDAPARKQWLPTALAALSMVAGLAAGVQVYRVGDSGARAAWGDRVSSSAR